MAGRIEIFQVHLIARSESLDDIQEAECSLDRNPLSTPDLCRD